MKYLIIFIITLLYNVSGYSQLKSKVQTISGVEVYIMAEPLREYEILEGTSKSAQLGSPLTRGLSNPSISTRVWKYIKKIKKGLNKKGESLEAVMYTKGKSMSAIRFISPPTDENYRVGVVKEVNGIPFFVMSKPIDDYKEVGKVWNGLKLKSFVTLGIANNSIEKDLKEFSKWSKNEFKKGEISALMYTDGKKAVSIKF